MDDTFVCEFFEILAVEIVFGMMWALGEILMRFYGVVYLTIFLWYINCSLQYCLSCSVVL